MRNTKDYNWSLIKSVGGGYACDQAQLSVLMDIRDELKQLNKVFACSNFQAVPRILRTIGKNTAKPRYKQCTRCLENAVRKGECHTCGKRYWKA